MHLVLAAGSGITLHALSCSALISSSRCSLIRIWQSPTWNSHLSRLRASTAASLASAPSRAAAAAASRRSAWRFRGGATTTAGGGSAHPPKIEANAHAAQRFCPRSMSTAQRPLS